MTTGGFTTVGTRTVADLKFISVQMRDVITPSGETVERTVVTHPGAVAVVPFIDGDSIMIEQYRVAVDRVVMEIPAGKIDDPADLRVDTAHRELEEETGFRSSSMTKLVDLLTSVGFSDEVITVYLLRGSPKAHEHQWGTKKRPPALFACRFRVRSMLCIGAKSPMPNR